MHSSHLQKAATRSGGPALPSTRGWVPQPHAASITGHPLPGPIRQQMETAFRTDFRSVRIHEGREAAAIGANAFTRGEHLYFAPGMYRPESREGQQRIGHELTHVMTQRAGRIPRPALGTAIVQNRQLEAEAESQGARAAAGQTVTVQGVAAGAQPRAKEGGAGVVQCQGGELLKLWKPFQALGSAPFRYGFSKGSHESIKKTHLPLPYTSSRNYHVGFNEMDAKTLTKRRNQFTLFRGVEAKFGHHAPLAKKYRGMSEEQLKDVKPAPTTAYEAWLHYKHPDKSDYGVSTTTNAGIAMLSGGKDNLIQVLDMEGAEETATGDPAQFEKVYKDRIDPARVIGVISPEELKKHEDERKLKPEHQQKMQDIEKMKRTRELQKWAKLYGSRG